MICCSAIDKYAKPLLLGAYDRAGCSQLPPQRPPNSPAPPDSPLTPLALASPADHCPVYNSCMSAARPKTPTVPKASPSPAKRQDLARGLPGTDRERAKQRRRFAEEHRETLRRLGK